MLTDKQQKVLDIIVDFIGRYGKSPTIEELTVLTNQKSKRGVVQYLETLKRKGFLTRTKGHRGIRLGNSIGFQNTLIVPILGYANAGTPLAYANQNDYGSLTISKKLISGDVSNYFFLKVEGTSMNDCEVKGKKIENGSYVLIKKDEVNINSKNPYLFIVDNAATIKIPKTQGKNLYLLPKSKDEYHKPIVLSSSDKVMVNGKVVDVFSFN